MENGNEETQDKTPHDYIAEVSILIRRKSWKNAWSLAREAHEHHPSDPFVISYFGYLTALANKKSDKGVKACKKALKALKKSDYEKDISYPWLYLNLGKACLANSNKKDAYISFHKGLAKDKENKDLLWELRKLGLRRPPVIPFLNRTNFINRTLGKIRHKLMLMR
jgi:tetratricopeptide (TPR) repeat protein